MLFRRVHLFRFFGFAVSADASWIFLSVLISWTLSTYIYPAMHAGYSPEVYQFMGIATLAGLIASIIAHEVAHAVIAQYYQMPIAGIVLFFFGGVAEMRGEPSHPKGEFFMAIAGPVMSVLMGFLFWAAAKLGTQWIGDGPVPQVLDYLGNINMLIAGLNMVPAFPLDGGRALRAIIWYYKNNLVLATRIASSAGATFAYLLLGYACWRIVLNDDMVGGMWSGLLGLFMHGCCTFAVRQTETRSVLGQERVSRFMRNDITTVSPDLTITELVDNFVYKHYQRSFPVLDRGELAGFITLQSVLSVDRHKWHWLHVASVMEAPTEATVIDPDSSAADALDVMERGKKDQLIVAKGRQFLGVVTFRDLVAYTAITLRVDHNKPVEMSRTAY